VFRSKSPGFRVLSGSGLFHGRCLTRRRRRFTSVPAEQLRVREQSPELGLCTCGHASLCWNKDGTFAGALLRLTAAVRPRLTDSLGCAPVRSCAVIMTSSHGGHGVAGSTGSMIRSTGCPSTSFSGK